MTQKGHSSDLPVTIKLFLQTSKILIMPKMDQGIFDPVSSCPRIGTIQIIAFHNCEAFLASGWVVVIIGISWTGRATKDSHREYLIY